MPKPYPVEFQIVFDELVDAGHDHPPRRIEYHSSGSIGEFLFSRPRIASSWCRIGATDSASMSPVL